MKICYATDFLPGYHKKWAGAEQACYRLAKLLIKNNHKVALLTTKLKQSCEENLEVYELFTLMEDYGRRRVRLVLRNFLPFDPISGISCYKVLRRVKPDILHLHHSNSLSLSLILSAKTLGIPVVFSMYDHWSICPGGTLIDNKGQRCSNYQGPDCINCVHFGEKSMAIARKFGLLKQAFTLRRGITTLFFRKIDAFIVLSNSWAEILQQYGIDMRNINIVPLPLFEKFDIQNDVLEKNSILFVGWVYRHKGLHILIEAMLKVLKEIPGAKLYVIESGIDENYKSKIISSIKEFGIEGHVFFLGKRPNQEVRALLQRVEVVAVPEQWGISWPIFLTEAMVYGKPIVASRIGDIPQFIKDGENGLLADPQSPAEFAEKIIRMFKQEDTTEMGRKAREKVMQISDENKILEKLLSLYSSVLGRKTQ
jgi:glycosyltransferase involved in cell wall biosynthesis